MTAIEMAPRPMGAHRRQPRIAPWSQWLHDLTEHLDTYGKYPDYGTVLGSWVSRQRFAFKRGLLPNDQVAQLESLPGWLWDARRDPWPGNFERLRAHLAQHGTFPTTKHQRRWVTRQREEYASGHLSDERAGLLEALPGWSWEATAWGRSYSHFVAHIERTGRPPARRTKLYFWAGRQRRAFADGTLTAAQIRQLESLPGWMWNRKRQSWQEQYDQVARTVSESGTFPRSGSILAHWISRQRAAYKRGALSDREIALLEDLPGWWWSKPTWSEQYFSLVDYIAKNGRPPRTRTPLGRWISNQQATFRARELPEDQARKLESLPGWAWQ